MVRVDVIRQKLAVLHGYLGELKAHRAISFEDFVAGGDPQRAIERLLQLVVEAAVDINTHVATEAQGIPPTDYTDSFWSAAKSGLISVELATRLAPSAGLRNALVHEYGDIDNAKVHSAIPMAINGFRDYVREVNKWLSSQT